LFGDAALVATGNQRKKNLFGDELLTSDNIHKKQSLLSGDISVADSNRRRQSLFDEDACAVDSNARKQSLLEFGYTSSVGNGSARKKSLFSDAASTADGSNQRKKSLFDVDDSDDVLATTAAVSPQMLTRQPLKPAAAVTVSNGAMKKPILDSINDDFWGSAAFGQNSTTLPKIQPTNANTAAAGPAQQSSGRSSISSAKQLYLSKARYVPGRNTITGMQKENDLPWNQSNKPAGSSPSVNVSSKTYVPSFGSSPSKNTSNYHAVGGWKRVEPVAMDLNKTPANRALVGATGRTDWASKYLK
jgi:hypothetical protein